ncbi:MAG: hypothetical protein EOP89_12505 [Lysobacteraceae bacterium]|nr:MAG: hypothetical protein EOP89_12505 [Xanthomonadaceae bacterium]
MILTFLGVVAAAITAMAMLALLGGMSLGKAKQKLLRDREAGRLGRQVQGVGVHTQPNTVSQAYHHVH